MKKALTREQIEWRDSILRRRVIHVNKAAELTKATLLNDEDKLRRHFYYLNNCVFWVNEYIDGKVDKKRLLETALAMKLNAANLEKDLLNMITI